MYMFEYDENLDQLFIKNNIPEHTRISMQNALGIRKTEDFANYFEKEELLSLKLESTDLETIMRLHQQTILYLGEWSWRTAYKVMVDYDLKQDQRVYEALLTRLQLIKDHTTRNSHGTLQITNLTDRQHMNRILEILTRQIIKRKKDSSPDSLQDLLVKLKTM